MDLRKAEKPRRRGVKKSIEETEARWHEMNGETKDDARTYAIEKY
jgi:hypothetical protein